MINSISHRNKFPTYEISILDLQRPEMLGTKEKFWLSSIESDETTDYLFKVGRIGTGENWSEKLSSELAKIISLPCAEYEFATCQTIRGVISKRFFDQASTLLLGNLLLASFDNNYDQSKKYHQVSYTLTSTLGILRRIQKPEIPLRSFFGLPMKEVEIFAGYLVFDSWIGNTDRHHENWGVVATKDDKEGFVARLAPSYDHASSLGREFTDDKRKQLLEIKDDRRNIVAYANRGSSAFAGKDGAILKHHEVLSYLMTKYPKATAKWASVVCDITRQQTLDLFNNAQDEYMTEAAIEFALRLLQLNALKIQKVCFG